MDKFYSKDFYVGTLSIKKNNNEISLTKQEINDRKFLLTYRGAIKINDNNKEYDNFITIFYKIAKDQYFCLHDYKRYSINTELFCTNLVPIWNLLPKISYSKEANLSEYDAMDLFNKLFHQNNEFTYDNKEYDINDYYMGTLNLCYGYQLNNNSKIKLPYHYINQYEEQILSSNNHYNTEYSIKDKDNYKYDYRTYNCLFLDLHHNKEMYNINNYQVYPYGNFEKYNILHNNSFYQNLIPLKSEDNIKTLSINKALKLQKTNKR